MLYCRVLSCVVGLHSPVVWWLAIQWITINQLINFNSLRVKEIGIFSTVPTEILDALACLSKLRLVVEEEARGFFLSAKKVEDVTRQILR